MDRCYIEKNSLIAAGAVLLEGTRVESGTIYGGVPAKKIKDLTSEHFKTIVERISNNYIMYADWFKEDEG
jgi:gamma-carbonic anhydrase